MTTPEPKAPRASSGTIATPSPAATQAASAIGFVTWAYACARVDVSVAAATLYAVPVVAFSAGWLWLGERPAALALVGGAVALAGVAVVARGGRLRGRTAGIEEAGPKSRPLARRSWREHVAS
jgi:multidrug transporter EmrE-like cation transporter